MNKKVIIIDMGCGRNKIKPKNKDEIILGLDKFKLDCVDIICDLERGLPLKDNSVDIVVANNILEHIKNFFQIIEEMWRVTKPEGILKIIVPHFSSEKAFTNPDHKRVFGCFSFDYFLPNHPENYYTKARFKILKRKLVFIGNPKYKFLNKIFNPIANFNQIFFEKFLFKFLSMDDIRLELKVVK